MVALNSKRPIRSEELIPQLIVDNAYLRDVLQQIVGAVDDLLRRGPVDPFISVEGLRVGKLTPDRSLINIVGDWLRTEVSYKAEVMQHAGLACRQQQKVVPRIVTLASLGEVSDVGQDSERKPAFLTTAGTVDGRIAFTVKLLERVDSQWHLHASDPWTPIHVLSSAEMPQTALLMRAFWEGYKQPG